MVKGYKSFNKGLITNYNNKLEINKVYYASGDIIYHKNGFHLCTNLEDTFRYFNTFKQDVETAIVEGYGKINKFDDEYNGFYDMYSVEFIKINKLLTRSEIINYILMLPEYRIIRFISLFKLDEDEIELFKKIFYNNQNIIKAIMYYQENIKDVYNINYKIKKR